MNEDAVQATLKRAAERYQQFIQDCLRRELYPVQKGNPDDITLHRVTRSSHDDLSLPDDCNAMLRIATVRSSNEFFMRPLRHGIRTFNTMLKEFFQ